MIVAIAKKFATKADGYLSKRYDSNQFTYKKIFAMLFPLILDQFFIFFIGMLTTSMISASSQESVAAVSLVNPITFMVMALFNAVSNGGTIIVAQYKGKGDEGLMKKAAGQVIFTTFLVATVSSILLIVFAAPIINFIFSGSEAAVLDKAKDYLVGFSFSLPTFSIFNGIFNVLRGVGDTKTCLRLTVIINFIHLAISYLFINVMKLDIMGTALSFNVARIVGCVIALYIILSPKGILTLRFREMFGFNLKMQKSIIKMGIPFAVEQLFFNGGRMITQSYMVLLGTSSVAADSIAAAASNLFYGAGFGVSVLAITVVGQCVGAGDAALARKYGKQLVFLGNWMMILSLIVIYPFMPFVLSLFAPQAETLPLINHIILIGMIPIPFFWSMSNVMPSVLRAAGDANYTSILSLVTMWVFRVGFGYVLAIPFGLGLSGIWIAMGTEWAARSLLFMLRFKGDKWLQKKIV